MSHDHLDKAYVKGLALRAMKIIHPILNNKLTWYDAKHRWKIQHHINILDTETLEEGAEQLAKYTLATLEASSKLFSCALLDTCQESYVFSEDRVMFRFWWGNNARWGQLAGRIDIALAR